MSPVSNINEETKAKDDGNPGKEVQENATENNAANAKWKYSWGQNLKQIEVTIPLPIETGMEGINCVIKEKYLLVGIVGKAPIISGRLFQSVKVKDSFWVLEDKKKVYILLKKIDQSIMWNSLIKRDIEKGESSS